MSQLISPYDKFIYWLHQMTEANHIWVKALSSGFLIGRFTNEASVPQVGLLEAIESTFLLQERPINVLSIIALSLLIITFLGRPILSKIHVKRRYDLVFATLIQRHRARTITPYPGLAWGHTLSLQITPNISRGWNVSEVKIHHNTRKFSIPEKFGLAYKDYLSKYWSEKRFATDTTRVMLTQNPTAFSDNPALTLQTQELLNSQIQFYREMIAPIQSERDVLIRNAVTRNIEFAHTFSLHVVVLTNDEKVLLTKRSAKVTYYPETWSCSIEEQLSLEDINEPPDKRVRHWGTRAISEELGLGAESYNIDNYRILSVALESDILNIALIAVITLDIDADDLEQVLRGLPRTDYEFTEWSFLRKAELLEELFQPKRSYHPTSGYRMLLAAVHIYGEPVIAEKILRKK